MSSALRHVNAGRSIAAAGSRHLRGPEPRACVSGLHQHRRPGHRFRRSLGAGQRGEPTFGAVQRLHSPAVPLRHGQPAEVRQPVRTTSAGCPVGTGC